MIDTATLLWVDFKDSATFIISVAISASGLSKERSFAPAWKMYKTGANHALLALYNLSYLTF